VASSPFSQSGGVKGLALLLCMECKEARLIKGGNMMTNIYVDGSSKGNPGPAGIGIYIPGVGISLSTPIGEATNNEAEWMALVTAAYISQYISGDITIYTDSQLVAEQYNGNWKMKKLGLMRCYELARYYIDNQHSDVEVKHIPRTENGIANTLAQEAAASLGYVIVEKGLEEIVRRQLKKKDKKFCMTILPRNLISVFPPTPPHDSIDAIVPEPKAVVVRERSDYIFEHYDAVLVTSEKTWYLHNKPYAKADWVNKVE